MEQVGTDSPNLYSVKIDWKNNFFFIEGDGENDGPIKNLKESGIKNKAYSVVFVDEGEDKYTISMTMNGVTMTYKASTKKPVGPDIHGKMQSVKDAIDKGTDCDPS